MNHNTLANYYQMMFTLREHHGWSIDELEEKYPFERDVYIEFLIDLLERIEENRRNKGV